MPSKERLRSRFKRVRMDLTDRYRRTAARDIHRHLLNLPEVKSAKTVGVYLSKEPEVDTLRLLKRLYHRKKVVAAPRVRGETLRFFRIRKGLKDCQPGHFSVMEPKPGSPEVPAKKIDVLLVPGVVFDREGHRLGYGKGFYDRFLGRNPRLISIGLAYDKTVVPVLPVDKRDIPVAFVVTEKGVLRIFDRLLSLSLKRR